MILRVEVIALCGNLPLHTAVLSLDLALISARNWAPTSVMMRTFTHARRRAMLGPYSSTHLKIT